MPLYLDNAATTPICKEVLDEMLSSLKDFGNSESKYYCYAENAKKNISIARNRIANAVGCEPENVIFTSGATEANNLIIKGFAEANPEKKKIIISSIEHSSVVFPCKYLEKKGYEIVKINVDSTGKIKLDELENAIDDNTLLVSIIWVNNEIGTIQDIYAIDEICKRHGVFFHSDATQAIGKVNIDLSKYKALMAITFTAHKIYGPKGIGALILKNDSNGVKVNLVPLLHGGEQENGYRAGTLSNELIVGFGKACEMATKNIEKDNAVLLTLETELVSRLKNKFKDIFILNNNWYHRIPGLINIQLKGFNNMIILKEISPIIAASTGSACSVSKPSEVLKAIGLSDKEISWSIRLSLSKYNTIDDFDCIEEL